MLSISISKNQSAKVRGAYAFQHMSIITKSSQDVIQYYKNITSPIRANARIQRETYMNSTKYAHKLQKKNSKDEQGGLKEEGPGQSTDDPRFLYASLISNQKNP